MGGCEIVPQGENVQRQPVDIIRVSYDMWQRNVAIAGAQDAPWFDYSL